MKQSSEIPSHTSHMMNGTMHPCWVRFGIPIYILSTLALLLASDIGSGVSADLVFTIDGILETEGTVLTVSVFSSVRALHQAKSYALMILIILTSISWPYVKLLLALYCWITPIRNIQRRERLLHWLDVLGKWSFVDIFVLLIIMVAFRSTNDQGQGALIDVYIVPKWGFYGFVFASMMSLIITHLIVHLHRLVMYPVTNITNLIETKVYDNQGDGENPSTAPNGNNSLSFDPSTKTKLFEIAAPNKSMLLFIPLASSLAFVVAGAFIMIFTFSYSFGDESTETEYSLISIGTHVAKASRYNPNRFGIRWIQIMYFILAIAAPIWNMLLCVILYFIPMTVSSQRRLFLILEMTYAWNAVDVFVVSAIFSVFQIPKFGTGIVKSGCSTCFVVESQWMPTLAVIAVGALTSIITCHMLNYFARRSLYP